MDKDEHELKFSFRFDGCTKLWKNQRIVNDGREIYFCDRNDVQHLRSEKGLIIVSARRRIDG